MPTRRDFLHASLVAGTGLAAAAAAAQSRPDEQPETERAERPMRLLILGGTGFLGPAIVDAALARGHELTLFNRGRTNTQLYPELDKLRGDRDPLKPPGLAALAEGTWDAVIDTSGYFPRLVRASAELLAPRVGQYVYISSISVYADNSIPDMDETGKLATMPDETLESFGEGYEFYGALKALCEQAAEAAMPGKVTNIRPGLIVGPRDNVPRFTYWPVRIEMGGEVLAPGSPDDPVQYIDVRDLAEFAVKTVEDATTGVFNATGPNWPTNIAELLYGCKAVTGGSATFTWVDADFLAERGINPWTDMPVWIPPRDEYLGFHRVNIDRAVDAGLRSRPLADTVSATLAWYHGRPDDKPFRWVGGIATQDHSAVDLAREKALLDDWHSREPG